MPKAVVADTEPNPEEGELLDEEEVLPWMEEPPQTSLLTPVPIAGQGVTVSVVDPYPYDPTRDESIANHVSVVSGWRFEDVAFDRLDERSEDTEAIMRGSIARLMDLGVPGDRAQSAVLAAHQMGYAFRLD